MCAISSLKSSRSLSHLLMSSCGTVPACDGQMDRRTDRRTHDNSIHRASIASRGKNGRLASLTSNPLVTHSPNLELWAKNELKCMPQVGMVGVM